MCWRDWPDTKGTDLGREKEPTDEDWGRRSSPGSRNTMARSTSSIRQSVVKTTTLIATDRGSPSPALFAVVVLAVSFVMFLANTRITIDGDWVIKRNWLGKVVKCARGDLITIELHQPDIQLHLQRWKRCFQGRTGLVVRRANSRHQDLGGSLQDGRFPAS